MEIKEEETSAFLLTINLDVREVITFCLHPCLPKVTVIFVGVKLKCYL